MEKIMDSMYGVVIFYLIITFLSFLVAINVKTYQDKKDIPENTYIAYNETTNTDL